MFLTCLLPLCVATATSWSSFGCWYYTSKALFRERLQDFNLPSRYQEVLAVADAAMGVASSHISFRTGR
jgi:hypothetical protein